MSNLISAENYINFSDVIFSAFISKKKVTDYIQNGYEIINETNELNKNIELVAFEDALEDLTDNSQIDNSKNTKNFVNDA